MSAPPVDEPQPGSQPPAEGELLVVAGEASGDLHGARLLTELRDLVPNLRAFGLGGNELRDAGLDLIARSSEISVVGITEAMRILPRARDIYHRLLAEVDRRGARAAVLIDFPDFNLRLARALKARGVKVIYYISPQIWAWRRGRVKTIARLVDRMLVILPFEVDFYRQHGVEAIHVGHPLVDEVPNLPQRWESQKSPGEPFQVALLPGSRTSEIESNLPVMLDAAQSLGEMESIRLRLVRAATVTNAELREQLEGRELEVEIVSEDRFGVLADSHLAICASGTATLEVGLLGTPMIVVYRVRPWTYFLGRLLVRLPHIALVNLVLGQSVVPELIQHEATRDRIARLGSEILQDRDRIREMRSHLGDLRDRLGHAGASRRAAVQVMEELVALTPQS